MPVHQEELYFIHHEFESSYEIGKAKEYLNHHEPIGSTVDWWDSEVTVTGFDNKHGAQIFLENMLDYVDNQ